LGLARGTTRARGWGGRTIVNSQKGRISGDFQKKREGKKSVQKGGGGADAQGSLLGRGGIKGGQWERGVNIMYGKVKSKGKPKGGMRGRTHSPKKLIQRRFPGIMEFLRGRRGPSREGNDPEGRRDDCVNTLGGTKAFRKFHIERNATLRGMNGWKGELNRRERNSETCNDEKDFPRPSARNRWEDQFNGNPDGNRS